MSADRPTGDDQRLTEDVWQALYEAEDDYRYESQQPPARRDEARIQETRAVLDAARLAARADKDAAAIAAVRALADWYDAQVNWREWRIGASIRAALDAAPPTAEETS